MASLVSECFIKAKHHVEQSRQPHYLGPDDLIMLSMQYMQPGLLFRNPPNFNIETFLEKLKDALSLTLVHFYPLAGRLATKKYPNEHSCWVYVDPNKGSGARFIHAKVDMNISDITIMSSKDNFPVIRSLYELGEEGVVNHDGHTRALLSLQVTQLIDGLFIGFTMNHALADGTSLWHFINTLSEIYISSLCLDGDKILISHIPIYRPLCWWETKTETETETETDPIIKLPYLEPAEFITRFDQIVQVRGKTFRFSVESVKKLKAIANEECGDKSLTISSFQSVCALVWKSITKARNLPENEETTWFFVVNTRIRFSPPLSQHHFGNFGSLAQGKCKVKELLTSGLGWAGLLLNRAVAAQDDKAVRNALEAYVKNPFVAQPGWSCSIFGSRPIVVGGSTRFDMYSPKFGLGKPVAVQSAYGCRPEGKMTVQPGCKGNGSVDLAMSLTDETIAKLESDEVFMSYVS